MPCGPDSTVADGTYRAEVKIVAMGVRHAFIVGCSANSGMHIPESTRRLSHGNRTRKEQGGLPFEMRNDDDTLTGYSGN